MRTYIYNFIHRNPAFGSFVNELSTEMGLDKTFVENRAAEMLVSALGDYNLESVPDSLTLISQEKRMAELAFLRFDHFKKTQMAQLVGSSKVTSRTYIEPSCSVSSEERIEPVLMNVLRNLRERASSEFEQGCVLYRGVLNSVLSLSAADDDRSITDDSDLSTSISRAQDAFATASKILNSAAKECKKAIEGIAEDQAG